MRSSDPENGIFERNWGEEDNQQIQMILLQLGRRSTECNRHLPGNTRNTPLEPNFESNNRTDLIKESTDDYSYQPIDGRYASKVSQLTECFSEYALLKNRVKVEVMWLIALCGQDLIGECRNLKAEEEQFYARSSPIHPG